jgi:regulator of sigma E protease
MNPLIEFIGGIAILIFVHELGHFLAARLFGVEVEEFGIGFPPRIVKLFEAGGTEFTLNWIPLGGFVRPKGENDPDVPGGLAAANPWVRLAVLFAGPLMNIGVGIILAVLLFYNLGDPVLDRIQVLQVAENSPAAEAGLMAEDVILEINGEKMNSSDNIYEAIQASLGEPTTIIYERDGSPGQVTLVPRADPPEGEGAIGIAMGPTTRPISLVTAVPRGVMASFDYTRAVLSLPVKIFQGEVSAEESRPLGYKGMYDVYTQLQNPLWFFTAISMSLGIFNLFPIPALDGGRILLTLPEILLRRRIPPKYENTIHLVGFTLLLLLLIYINVQDFVNPVQLP